ncbi:MAG: hypothetical protein BGO98_17010 [Myxococcales bacterium 68-20]|nr:MAG: hypothetical protein BGO98_17010 [Myxococcales bacterium 68-20]
MNKMRLTGFGQRTFMAAMIAGLGIIASALGGCSTGADVAHPDEGAEVASTGQHLLAAGDDARGLGIYSWRLHDDGRMEGLDAHAKVTTMFVEYRNGRGAESGADPSRRIVFDESGFLISDTLLASEHEVLAALRGDLIAATATQQNSESAPTKEVGGEKVGSVSQPVWIANLCCNAGYTGLIYQWWDAVGPTPYCSFQQQTGLCSGYPACGTLGPNLGCLYWGG